LLEHNAYVGKENKKHLYEFEHGQKVLNYKKTRILI